MELDLDFDLGDDLTNADPPPSSSKKDAVDSNDGVGADASKGAGADASALFNFGSFLVERGSSGADMQSGEGKTHANDNSSSSDKVGALNDDVRDKSKETKAVVAEEEVESNSVTRLPPIAGAKQVPKAAQPLPPPSSHIDFSFHYSGIFSRPLSPNSQRRVRLYASPDTPVLPPRSLIVPISPRAPPKQRYTSTMASWVKKDRQLLSRSARTSSSLSTIAEKKKHPPKLVAPLSPSPPSRRKKQQPLGQESQDDIDVRMRGPLAAVITLHVYEAPLLSENAKGSAHEEAWVRVPPATGKRQPPWYSFSFEPSLYGHLDKARAFSEVKKRLEAQYRRRYPAHMAKMYTVGVFDAIRAPSTELVYPSVTKDEADLLLRECTNCKKVFHRAMNEKGNCSKHKKRLGEVGEYFVNPKSLPVEEEEKRKFVKKLIADGDKRRQNCRERVWMCCGRLYSTQMRVQKDEHSSKRWGEVVLAKHMGCVRTMHNEDSPHLGRLFGDFISKRLEIEKAYQGKILAEQKKAAAKAAKERQKQRMKKLKAKKPWKLKTPKATEGEGRAEGPPQGETDSEEEEEEEEEKVDDEEEPKEEKQAEGNKSEDEWSMEDEDTPLPAAEDTFAGSYQPGYGGYVPGDSYNSGSYSPSTYTPGSYDPAAYSSSYNSAAYNPGSSGGYNPGGTASYTPGGSLTSASSASSVPSYVSTPAAAAPTIASTTTTLENDMLGDLDLDMSNL